MSSEQATNKHEQAPVKETKMLGALVELPLYWAFKQAAAARNEYLQDAIVHAARMYIDAIEPEKEDD